MFKFDKVYKSVFKESRKYEYSCVMCGVEETGLQSKIRSFVDSIDDNDLYIEDDDYGREYESHVTALFGLHSDKFLEIRDHLLAKYNKPKVEFKIKGVSAFQNEKFDVLKYDIESEDLTNMNSILKEMPYTNDFPDYHPHLTLAYLKPGMSKKYLKSTDLDGKSFSSNVLNFSFAGKTTEAKKKLYL